MGKRSNNGFKAEVWKELCKEVKARGKLDAVQVFHGYEDYDDSLDSSSSINTYGGSLAGRPHWREVSRQIGRCKFRSCQHDYHGFKAVT